MSNSNNCRWDVGNDVWYKICDYLISTDILCCLSHLSHYFQKLCKNARAWNTANIWKQYPPHVKTIFSAQQLKQLMWDWLEAKTRFDSSPYYALYRLLRVMWAHRYTQATMHTQLFMIY